MAAPETSSLESLLGEREQIQEFQIMIYELELRARSCGQARLRNLQPLRDHLRRASRCRCPEEVSLGSCRAFSPSTGRGDLQLPESLPHSIAGVRGPARRRPESHLESFCGRKVLLRQRRLLYFRLLKTEENDSLVCAEVSKSLRACFSSGVISFRPVQLVAEANEVDLARDSVYFVSDCVDIMPERIRSGQTHAIGASSGVHP